ncbi:hypothetical protein KC19_7G067700 [Ceratodon purpureus]|uniref:Tyrosinase copper-binding domain-containing protein n=1 Tax=Ceratodon purpureus TaxID=3225 RepID=A0A8T0H8D7_CERPU|nr:hypothetical protein KC19_7G067700 [Ceratodon purpureus]
MGQLRSTGMSPYSFLGLALFMALVAVTYAHLPIPAADLPTQCNSIERCCMPTPYKGKPAYNFEYKKFKKFNVRRPAHLLTKKEITRLEKAYTLMRALPDSDPRSLLNQMKLHCLYCDNALYYPGQQYPLEVHNGWFFLPWHRMFMYWHERILQKLLKDDTFTLPFWAWDNSMDVKPVPNEMPAPYARKGSSLYDEARNNCSFPPFLVDLDTAGGGCTTKTPDFIRIQNDRLQYTQLVVGATTPSLFFGLPYYFGDYGGKGSGTFEDQPHGTVHAWLGRQDAPILGPQYHPYDDMGNFGRAAFDPIFYPHHTNVDRIWCLWTHIPGGKRTHPTHPAFLNTQFTFYDENANLVKHNVSQALDTDLLGYKFESYPTPWMTNGVQAGRENSIPLCNPLSKKATESLISSTPKQRSTQVLLADPITFKVARPKKSKGTEVLEISGIHIPNKTAQAHWKVYLFYPNVSFLTGAACPEFAGTFNWIPHVGQVAYNPDRVWRMGVGPKLLQMGKDYVKSIVVTVVQTGFPLQALTFDSAKIIYDNSPEVEL